MRKRVLSIIILSLILVTVHVGQRRWAIMTYGGIPLSSIGLLKFNMWWVAQHSNKNFRNNIFVELFNKYLYWSSWSGLQ